MNIEKFFEKIFSNKKKEEIYTKLFKRANAGLIDFSITTMIRMFIAQIYGSFYFNAILKNFHEEFYNKFGTRDFKGTREHVDFIIQSSAFSNFLILCLMLLLVGAIYHSYFNSSAWSATPGKRLLKIMVLSEDGAKISFANAFKHYSLSLMPMVFIFYVISSQATNKLTIYQFLNSSLTLQILAVLMVMWTQIAFFTKKKNTIYDILCKVAFVNGRTSGKLFSRNIR